MSTAAHIFDEVSKTYLYIDKLSTISFPNSPLFDRLRSYGAGLHGVEDLQEQPSTVLTWDEAVAFARGVVQYWNKELAHDQDDDVMVAYDLWHLDWAGRLLAFATAHPDGNFWAITDNDSVLFSDVDAARGPYAEWES